MIRKSVVQHARMLSRVSTPFKAADFALKRKYWFVWDDKAHAAGHPVSNWLPDGYARLYVVDDPRFQDTPEAEFGQTPEAKLAREVGAVAVYRVSRWLVYSFKHTSNALAAKPRIDAHCGKSEQGLMDGLTSEQQRGNCLVVQA